METVARIVEPDPGDAAADVPGYREMPRNVEAEQALLGAILVDNASFDRVSSLLEPDHFHVPVHGRIFDAARQLISGGRVADPLTLKAYFESDGALGDVGGARYLARLAASATSLFHTGDYARTIRDLGVRRALIRLGEEVVETACDSRVEEPAEAQIEAAEARLYELAEAGRDERGFRPLSVAAAAAVAQAEAAYKRDGRLSGVATGLLDLDELLGGLHPSDLVVLAGRPSMGKTALATSIAFDAARRHRVEEGEDGKPATVDGAVVGFFSLEMSAEQLATRILAERAGLRSDYIRRGKLSNEEFARLADASRELAAAPLFIDDTPALSVPALRTRARRLKRSHGMSLIVLDYLQLMRPARRHESRVMEISEITQGLKAVAKEFDVPVLALSQLSRAVEQRDDKRPILSDLRDSGTIEQDSDVVMFVFREEYYLERGEPQRRDAESDENFDKRYQRWQARYEANSGLADLIVAKQRHGPIGSVKLRFAANTASFANYAPAERLPEQTL